MPSPDPDLPTQSIEPLDATAAHRPEDLVRHWKVASAGVEGGSGPRPTADRYVLGEEIGRGGMGTVYQATDTVLDREVAVKVLQSRFELDSATARRFAEEARITGQLQHPGIPAVHDLGLLPDGRPFLAMKLVKGSTLDAWLGRPSTGGAGLGQVGAVFESICQAVAFAHERGVVHRDLKPSNVMVGRFGEVQVMDWGLAKTSIPRGADPAHAGGSTESTADVTAIRPPGDDVLTRAGSILGTPAYMAPEQAIGAVDQIDFRSDVFGLGGILAALLTGRPPFLGDAAESTRQMAAKGMVGDCFARLDASGADPEFVALAKRCLAPEKADRPADAVVVAQEVAALRSAAEERTRQAELDRGRAMVKAAEERKRRRVQSVLAAALVALALGGGLFAWGIAQRTNEQRVRKEQASQGVTTNLNLAADLRKQYKFPAADNALAQASDLAKAGAEDRAAEVEQAQADLAFVVALDEIRYGKWLWIDQAGGKGRYSESRAPTAYREAFAARGLELTTRAPADAAARIAASGIAAELVAAIDDWSLYEPSDALAERLLEVARRADPGEWTDRLRDPAVRKDRAALQRLAADADPTRVRPAAVVVLAALMWRARLDTSPVLSQARAVHPTEFDLAFHLGQWYNQITDNKADARGAGPFEAACALRPDLPSVWNSLGRARYSQNDLPGAIAAYRQGIKLKPDQPFPYFNLGVALRDQGDLSGAADAYRQVIQLDPAYAPAYSNLGSLHLQQNDLPRAIDFFRQAASVDPTFVLAHYNLGHALARQNDDPGAVAAYRQAIQHDPQYAEAHCNLGLLLLKQGKPKEALPLLKRGHELGSKRPGWGNPSAAWVADCEKAMVEKR